MIDAIYERKDRLHAKQCQMFGFCFCSPCDRLQCLVCGKVPCLLILDCLLRSCLWSTYHCKNTRNCVPQNLWRLCHVTSNSKPSHGREWCPCRILSINTLIGFSFDISLWFFCILPADNLQRQKVFDVRLFENTTPTTTNCCAGYVQIF